MKPICVLSEILNKFVEKHGFFVTYVVCFEILHRKQGGFSKKNKSHNKTTCHLPNIYKPNLDKTY